MLRITITNARKESWYEYRLGEILDVVSFDQGIFCVSDDEAGNKYICEDDCKINIQKRLYVVYCIRPSGTVFFVNKLFEILEEAKNMMLYFNGKRLPQYIFYLYSFNFEA